MTDRQRFKTECKQVDDFVEDYKKREDDIYYSEPLDVFKKTKPLAEGIKYDKFKYIYKGRVYYRRVVSQYRKGGLV